MSYTVYRITCPPAQREIVLALLADAGLEAFEEKDYGLDAYGNTEQLTNHRQVISEISQSYELIVSEEDLPERNWNAEWESSFQPIRIGDQVHIRASFHRADPGVTHDLIIDPKMAFGTGHHATTRLMCELMLEVYAAGPPPPSVLDYGSGTGVLAILAKRCGSRRVDAVDIELAAAQNTRENAELNEARLNHVLHGTLDDVAAGQTYDLVLANINRNVLLATGAALYERLRPGGTLLVSGILEPDAEQLVGHMRATGLRHRETRNREDWRAFVFVRD